MTPTVYVMPFCRGPEFLYGSTLFFRSIRVGFPTAKIWVVDNSPVEMAEIPRMAQYISAEYRKLPRVIQHYEFIASVLTTDASPAVIIDPDLAFWGNCEDFRFSALMAGRYIPTFMCEYSRCLTMERLHTSFIWIQDVRALRDRINALCAGRREFPPLQPLMIPGEPNWQRYDTMALLYAAIKNDCHSMTDKELSRFDHLFCGSNIDQVAPGLNDGARLSSLHDEVKVNLDALRGAWSWQREHFESRAVT